MYPPSKVEPAGTKFRPVLKCKGLGLVDLGEYPTARKAAVAHDVARLLYIHEKRPETDLRCDMGLLHPADGYLLDNAFIQLQQSGTKFDTVCELLRSGALVDNFLCAQERQTRSTHSGDQPLGSHGQQRSGCAAPTPSLRGEAGGAAAAGPAPAKQQRSSSPAKQPSHQQSHQQQQKQQQPSHRSSDDTHHAVQPPRSPFEAATGGGAAAPAAGDAGGAQPPAGGTPTAMDVGDGPADGSPSGAKRKAKWLEWPSRGGGQYVSELSARALKASTFTLPAKMKRELFQVTQLPAPIAVHDLQPGSTLRWSWEVRDWSNDNRRVTSIHNLGPFLKHYGAVAGDVVVVVASAPGAVKAAIWKGDSQEATDFKSFQEKEDKQRQDKAGKQPASGGRKRAADGPADKPAAAKAAKASGGKAAATNPPPGMPSLSPDASRPVSKTGSGCPPQQRHEQQQGGAAAAPPKARPPLVKQPSRPSGHAAQQAAHAAEAAPPALAESGGQRSHPSGDETQAPSPRGQVAQSPYRHQPLLPPLASTTIVVKQEQQASPQRQEEQAHGGAAAAAGDAADAAAAQAAAGAGTGEAAGAAHSPARMSCADASQLLGGQPAVNDPGAAALGSTQQHQQQQLLSQPAASGAGAIGTGTGGLSQELPEASLLESDEGGVYVAMSRLLNFVASSGRVQPEAVSAYRRSFARLEPHGRRWFAYDSLKQLVDGGEWAGVAQWLK